MNIVDHAGFKDYLKAKGFSKKRLAKVMSVTQSTVSNISIGKTQASYDVLNGLVYSFRSQRKKLSTISSSMIAQRVIQQI